MRYCGTPKDDRELADCKRQRRTNPKAHTKKDVEYLDAGHTEEELAAKKAAERAKAKGKTAKKVKKGKASGRKRKRAAETSSSEKDNEEEEMEESD